mmetsp:Transcript_11710/g.50172  ORF Transcript_11710/g.50172 Transcript_11710/m.50172 type:complete len:286 (-) Transcript_11710:1028-1885(-)
MGLGASGVACVALERVAGTACVATSASANRTDGVFSLNGRHSMDALFHSVMASTSVRRASQGCPKLERLRNTCSVVFCASALVTTFSSAISVSEPWLTHGLETGFARLRRPGLAASASAAARAAASDLCWSSFSAAIFPPSCDRYPSVFSRNSCRDAYRWSAPDRPSAFAPSPSAPSRPRASARSCRYASMSFALSASTRRRYSALVGVLPPPSPVICAARAMEAAMEAACSSRRRRIKSFAIFSCALATKRLRATASSRASPAASATTRRHSLICLKCSSFSRF